MQASLRGGPWAEESRLARDRRCLKVMTGAGGLLRSLRGAAQALWGHLKVDSPVLLGPERVREPHFALLCNFEGIGTLLAPPAGGGPGAFLGEVWRWETSRLRGQLGWAAREMQVPVEHLLLSPASASSPPTEAPEATQQVPPGRLLLLRSVPLSTGEEIHLVLTRVNV